MFSRRSPHHLTQRPETILAPPPSTPWVEAVTKDDRFTRGMDDDQRACWEKVVLQGKSMFITGGAGVGKSLLVQRISAALRVKHSHATSGDQHADPELGVVRAPVTATSGTAAVAIGGVTLHSWAGVGLAQAEAPEILRRMTKRCRRNWMESRSLIVDEISMMSLRVFELLDQLGRFIRGRHQLPFGGLQLVAVGDFFQLPPVPDDIDREMAGGPPRFGPASSAFAARQRVKVTDERSTDADTVSAYFSCGPLPTPQPTGGGETVDLTVDEGTSADERRAFLDMRATLSHTQGLYEYAPGGAPSLFCFSSRSWIRAFSPSLGTVTVLTRVYRQDGDGVFSALLNRMRRGRMTAEDVAMLRARADASPAFDDEMAQLGIRPTSLFPRRDEVDRANHAGLADLPGAPVVFTMQCGMSSGDRHHLDGARRMIIDSGLAPEHVHLKLGAQVMLTCNANGDLGLYNGSRGVVVGFETDSSKLTSLMAKPDADADAEADVETTATSTREPLPVVRFCNGRTLIVERQRRRVKNAQDGWKGYFTQVPLELAFASTIHKAQGASLDCARVDLKRLFAEHQGYVALSRLRSLKGLSLTGFAADRIRVNPRVAVYYDGLERVLSGSC